MNNECDIDAGQEEEEREGESWRWRRGWAPSPSKHRSNKAGSPGGTSEVQVHAVTRCCGVVSVCFLGLMARKNQSNNTKVKVKFSEIKMTY